MQPEQSMCITFNSALRNNIQLGNTNHLGYYEYWHTPNERKTSHAQGALLKRMGVLAGVPDYVFVFHRNGCPQFAFIEFKVCKRKLAHDLIPQLKRVGELTPKQYEFREKCIKHKIPHFIAYNPDEALDWLVQIGFLRERTV